MDVTGELDFIRGELERFVIEFGIDQLKNLFRICNYNVPQHFYKLVADCYLANHWILNRNL